MSRTASAMSRSADGPGALPAPHRRAWPRFGLQAIARVRVEGLDDLPTSGPLIIAANHMSNADPPFIGGWLGPALDRRPTFLAKDVALRGPAGHPHPLPGRGAGQGRRQRHRRLPHGQGHPRPRWRGGHPAGGHAQLSTASWASPSPASRCWPRGRARRSLPVGISGTDRLLGRGQALPAIGTRIILRVGRPFQLAIPDGADRRAALADADAELMRRIAALVEPRHRGAWEPWPQD